MTSASDPTIRPYHHGNLRTDLVIAGLEMLKRGRLEDLTLRAVAARVGVSHTAPKNHFKDLRALTTAIATEGFWQLALAMRDTMRGAGDDHAKLCAGARGYLDFARNRPELFRLMASPTRCDRDDPALREAEAASIRLLGKLSDGMGCPDGLLHSLLFGQAMLWISGQVPSAAAGAGDADFAALVSDLARRSQQPISRSSSPVSTSMQRSRAS